MTERYPPLPSCTTPPNFSAIKFRGSRRERSSVSFLLQRGESAAQGVAGGIFPMPPCPAGIHVEPHPVWRRILRRFEDRCCCANRLWYHTRIESFRPRPRAEILGCPRSSH